MEDEEEQQNEKLALESMFENEEIQFFKEEGRMSGNIAVNTYLENSLTIECSDDAKYLQYKNKQDGKLKLKFLPPVELQFSLPPNYPSSAPPIYTLICKWLNNEQFNKVCKQFDDIWTDSEGQVVLYRWINYLQNDLLNTLEISNTINFTSCNTDLNKKAVNFNLSPEEIVEYVLEHNKQTLEIEFENSLHDCAICFESMSGRNCFRFIPCDHAFCNNCITDYFRVLIDEGSVNNLVCPSDKCESEALPQQVKKCLSEGLFERYERLLLQYAIDQMDNIIFCPRSWCGTPVLFGSNENYEECPKCHYVFCRICKRASHGVNSCTIRPEDMQSIRDAYLKANSSEKAALEREYGQKTIKKLIEEMSSNEWLKENSKKCPNCRTFIQKASGCNRMQCWKCRQNFCWICNKVLNKYSPYTHFTDHQSPCYNQLFQGMVLEDDDDEEDDEFL
ncbi:unnamed protein product [Dimorphilus gyrociliatus]|uniref:RBR-type E3 ubiquitin transferase n=1 Tax=Dimorphilus gyrociliatus TaxID=2664684 RepID=A0A7I8V684_9ANNE|nr:unnamed protein product [Dimorphilus gyrociliatus]